MTKIKICGIRNQQTYELLAKLNVDWAGFVFYPPSPRYVTTEQLKFLSHSAKEGPKKVGLFVNPSLVEIERILDQVQLDILQIYGQLETAQAIQTQFKLPVWSAIGVKSVKDLPSRCAVDGLVVEAPAIASDSRPGGNGRAFDWSLTQQWISPVPWILAGGLTPENVIQAIYLSGAQAVDVSSGVESTRGIKDAKLISCFVENIRQSSIPS